MTQIYMIFSSDFMPVCDNQKSGKESSRFSHECIAIVEAICDIGTHERRLVLAYKGNKEKTQRMINYVIIRESSQNTIKNTNYKLRKFFVSFFL